MTNRYQCKKRFSAIFSILLITLTFILTMLFSDKISHSVKSGLSLCANVIIPSVFPFMILSDFLYAYIDFSSLNHIGNLFEKTFKINRIGLYPFLLGMLCGFPLGVKCTAQLYKTGSISKDEAERLIGFSNNTGPAFLVCGIGLGLRASISEGFILYIFMMLSALAVGIIFSFGKKASGNSANEKETTDFSITDSIKNAGINTLNICSYLTFFACVVGLLRGTIGENTFYLLSIPFLEVGSATSILSKTLLLSNTESLILSAFAVGFSGFSVHLQALSFISNTDISPKRYFIMKFIQGILCAAGVAAAYALFPFL